MAAWNQNPYQNAYGVPGYNPAPNFMSQNYAPMPQSQPNYMNAPVQPQQGLQGQSMVLQGRMVTSREEALGVPVDLMGNPIFLADLAHKKIYMKKLNMNTGASDIFEFELNEDTSNAGEQPIAHAGDFTSRKDFDELNNTVSQIKDTVELLESEMSKFKKSINSKNNTKTEQAKS